MSPHEIYTSRDPHIFLNKDKVFQYVLNIYVKFLNVVLGKRTYATRHANRNFGANLTAANEDIVSQFRILLANLYYTSDK